MGLNLKKLGEDAGSFEALPDDRYTLLVENAEAVRASTGKEMIKVTFVVTDGKFAKRKLWHNFITEGKAVVFLIQFLKAIKSPYANAEDVTAQQIANSIKGAAVSVWAEKRTTINGNETNALSKFQAVDGPTGGSAPSSSGSGKKLFS